MTHHYDSSASGYLSDSFEGISQTFTDVEIMSTSEVNVVAKAKRYGRWWLLKGLRKEVAAEAGYQQRLRKELEILMLLQHPNVVAAYGIEVVEGLGRCIVMEYVDEDVKPRKATLDILSHFLGYEDWDAYCQNSLLPKEQQSSPIMSRRLSVANELNKGERLRLTWQPDRVCDIEYLGDLQFRVTASENTRLKAGDTFECSLIIEGEPLYLDHLKQTGQQSISYVCGKLSGVFFEFV